MIGIIILALPIIFLLLGIAYCSICIWRAHKGITISTMEQTDELQKQHKKGIVRYSVYFILFILVIVGAEMYQEWVSQQENASTYFFESFLIQIFSVVINFLSTTDFVKNLQKLDFFDTFFSRKSFVIIVSTILWLLIGGGVCKAYFSTDMLVAFLSIGSNFQLVNAACVLLSTMLIISAAVNFTRKMLECVKNT